MSAHTQHNPATKKTDLQALAILADNLRKDDNLRRRAIEIRDQICALQLDWYESVTQQLHRLDARKSPSAINARIADLKDQLELVLAEFRDRRRI